MKKQHYILAMAIFLMITMTTGFAHTAVFDDIKPDYWAKENIEQLVDQGIINGYPDGTFKPYKALTIQEFIKMTVLALDMDVREKREGEKWSTPYMESAMNIGKTVDSHGNVITIGLTTNVDTFLDKPITESITRAEMAYVVHYALMEQEKTDTIDVNRAIEGKIADKALISNRLYDSVVVAYGKGIIVGYPDGNFNPNNVLSRGEACAVVMKMMNEDKREKVSLSNIPTSVDHYPVENEAYSHVKRLDYNTITFNAYRIGKEYRQYGVDFRPVDAPVIEGVERTELLDFIIKTNNYTIDHYNGEQSIQSYDYYGRNVGINKHMDIINEFNDGFAVQYGMNFYFDDTTDDSYQASMAIAQSYDAIVNGNGVVLDPTLVVAITSVGLNTSINNNHDYYSTLAGWSDKSSDKFGTPYLFIISDVANLQGNIKDSFYYQLDVLFEKEAEPIKEMFDEFSNVKRLTEDDLGKTFESMGFKKTDNGYNFYGSEANNRAFHIITDGNTNEVTLRVSLKD